MGAQQQSLLRDIPLKNIVLFASKQIKYTHPFLHGKFGNVFSRFLRRPAMDDHSFVTVQVRSIRASFRLILMNFYHYVAFRSEPIMHV